MNIRRAETQDIPEILKLLGQVLETHVQLRPDIFNPNTTKFRQEELRDMISDDKNPIYVAVEKDAVVGYAFCQIRVPQPTHLMKQRKTLHIDDFCIDQNHRRHGIGKALFAFIKQEALRLGCEDITLNSWAGNDAANDFYRKMGLKPRSTIMELAVRP